MCTISTRTLHSNIFVSPAWHPQLSGEPPLKKLAIREEPSEREKYDFVTAVKCYACGGGQTEGNEQVSLLTLPFEPQ